MDIKRLKIAFAVLDAVESRFQEAKEFIDSNLKEECEKEMITVDEVISYKFKRFCLRIGTIVVWYCSSNRLFFCLQMWKGSADSKKAKRA